MSNQATPTVLRVGQPICGATSVSAVSFRNRAFGRFLKAMRSGSPSLS
jgi:hypothetical protein